MMWERTKVEEDSKRGKTYKFFFFTQNQDTFTHTNQIQFINKPLELLRAICRIDLN